MEELITINGKVIEKRPYLRSIMYGEGVFETFRYSGRLPKTIDEHYKRLIEGAKFLKIPPVSKEDFIYYVEKTISHFEEKDLYVKVILLPEGKNYYPLFPYQTNIMVIVKPFSPSKEKITLTFSPFKVNSTDPLLRYKTTNYLRNIVGKRYALEKGFDDVIFINEKDEITETSSANIFWVKGKYLFTPSVECGLLPGITRKRVLQEAPKIGFIVVEGRFHYKHIKDADFVFVTNALNGIIRVSKVDLFTK